MASLEHTIERPCVVISQPMYFPWVGMLQQIRLADVFVFYDDVQFSRGGFLNRVQVKTNEGVRWMTVPLRKQRLGHLINEVAIDERTNWRQAHLDLLTRAYAEAPYWQDVTKILQDVLSQPVHSLAELGQASTAALIDYFGLEQGRRFVRSSDLHIPGRSTQRVVAVCVHCKARTYLTGHGARNYLDHRAFEARGMEVSYIDYGLSPYPQLHGDFTPYVTALDLVAHCGRDGVRSIVGTARDWRSFLAAHPPEPEKTT